MAYTTIDKSELFFNTKLYTGNNTSQNITGLEFKPDWSWIKSRSNTEKHVLQDVLTGTAQELTSQDNSAKNPTSGASITSFNSDGISVGSGNAVNDNSIPYVNWNWIANGSGSSNTDGSINTTKTSANTTSGFSLISYTGNGSSGATIGHGLGVVPAVVLVKRTNAVGDWVMYHKNMNTGNAAQYFAVLNTTAARASSAGIWYDTTPTSSLFYVGNDGATNDNGGEYIAYCFAEVQGFSNMSTFTGTANPGFIYTGFKPAFVMLKRVNTTGNWNMLDNKRANSFNPQDPLYANANTAEQTGDDYDLVSNGFVIRNASGGGGGDSGKYIYLAFAENPFVTSTGIPTPAR